MSFQSIRRILPHAIRDAGIDEQVSAARIVEEARLALIRLWGADRAAYVEPVSWTNGELRVVVRSASAAHTLRTSEVQWINEINRVIGSQRVKGIKVKKEGS